MEVIRSTRNPELQRARAALAGREPGVPVLQGDRLVDDALDAGLALEVVFVADERDERARALERRNVRVRRVDAGTLEQVSTLTSSPGILALAAAPAARDLATLPMRADTLILVLAGIADPGNLGAVARAAEAFGASALVVLAGGASPWNEKAVRGSMGSLLRIPVVHGATTDRVVSALAARGVKSVAAWTRGGEDPERHDWNGSHALWIGGETGELPAAARGFPGLTIPIAPRVESLNVAVAAAILLHASARNRQH